MVNTLISAVTGKLTSKGPEYLDIDVSGITLRISTPTTTVENIGDLGVTVKILTSLQTVSYTHLTLPTNREV